MINIQRDENANCPDLMITHYKHALNYAVSLKFAQILCITLK